MTRRPPSIALVTGFEPFGGETVNPSWSVAAALDGERIGGLRVRAVQLPCVFGAALDVLDAALAAHRPTLVLALGQAAGRCDFSLERVAINVDDARIADNAGATPVDEPVVPGAPAGHFSTLPIKAIVAALRQAGLPASVSQSAGTFVCNHVFFGLMDRLARGTGVRGGFMHLPLLPEQAARTPGQPSLPLDVMLAGTRRALATAVAVQQDARFSGGSIA
jgi:pyroglutamyl-peptidase